MLPPEILKQVKLIEIATRKMVNNLFAGEYHTAFKGQGLTFAEFREYVPGDDVRSISWNLTAKHGKPFVKRYDEERELTMMLAVDVSGSGLFGSQAYLKGEVLVHLAAVLAFSAAKNNDRVGLILFTDEVEHVVLPRKGRAQVHRILRDLLYFKPRGKRTDIGKALETMIGTLKKRATIFVLSDFLDDGFERQLRLVGKKHDAIAVIVEDRAEKHIPKMGLVELEDPESGEMTLVDTSSQLFQIEYASHYKKMVEVRDRQLNRAKVDIVKVDTSKDFVDPLIKFFLSRHR
ncbi:MAG: DUF58 domain-containing protein [Oligoflexia bacterium]|nr:DUF58 domain-containing protein [Oligoflexia bacterium]